MADLKEYARNKEGSDIGKIVIDRGLCIGAASCIAVSGTTYELDKENKVVVLDANDIDDATLLMSAESCPTKAILLFNKSGIQIFPK